MRHLTGSDGLVSGPAGVVAEAVPATGGGGWFAGKESEYDRDFAVDTEQLLGAIDCGSAWAWRATSRAAREVAAAEARAEGLFSDGS